MTANDQQLAIASYLILNAPTGEVDQVVADVIKLVGDSTVVSESALDSILRQYNTQQLLAVPVTAQTPHSSSSSSSSPLLITRYNQVSLGTHEQKQALQQQIEQLETDASTDSEKSATTTTTNVSDESHDEYYHPDLRTTYHFHHRTRQATPAAQKDLSQFTASEEVEALRSALSQQLQQYIQRAYQAKKAASAVFYVSSDNTLVACISAANTNLNNFWTGGWHAVYTYNIADKTLTGTLKLNVHYFEDGNVQLHADQTLPSTTLDSSDAPDLAKDVTAAISQFESHYQSSLEDMYVTIHQSTFKAMRRFLPVSRMKMNWSTHAHSLATEISK